jgi:hypothetical protein
MTIKRFPLISIVLGVVVLVGDGILLPIDKVIS